VAGGGGTDVLMTVNGIPGLNGTGGTAGITVVCFV
jgi:hypothetical protein